MRRLFVVIGFLALFGLPAPAMSVSYVSAGFGGKLGLVLLDDHPWWIDAAFDIGAHGDFTFSLGQAGWLHYYPSIGTFFGGDDHNGYHYSLVEVYFNVADLKYQPPLTIPVVKPFVGLGPMFCVQRQNWERDEWVRDHWEYRQSYHDSNLEYGFNIFAGCDFQFTPSFALTSEFRARPSSGWEAFKMLVGATFTIGQ